MNELSFRTNHRAPGDDYYDRQAEATRETEGTGEPEVHPLDTDAAKQEHRRLLTWFYHERDKQLENRLEQAIDADFYDNLQWDPEDAASVRERGIIDARVMQVEIRGADVDVRLSAEPHPHSSRSVAAKICAALWGGNATTAR